MNLFEISLKLKKFPIKEANQILKEWQDSDVNQYAEQKKWQIFEYHKTNNPTYVKFIKDKSISSWNDIPIITKKEIRNKNIITPHFSAKDLYKSKTSGSSGKPLIYVKDKLCHAMTWAYINKCYNDIDIAYGKDLQARFYAIPLEGAEYYTEKFKDFVSARKRLLIYNLSDEYIHQYLNVFKKSSFKYLYGYTNSIMIFAKYLAKNKIDITKICPSLQCCIVTSELCTPEDKQFLQETFNLNVYNEYGASELALVAMDSKDTHWPLNTFELFIEVLNDDNQPVKDGDSGRLVITSLYNKAMPFIRYDLGDIGTKKNNSLLQLDGRLNDMIYLPSGKTMPGFSLYYVTKSIVCKYPEIQEYLIKQTQLDTFTIEFVLDGMLSQKMINEVTKTFQRYLEKSIKVNIIKCNKIDRHPNDKCKHFISEINR